MSKEELVLEAIEHERNAQIIRARLESSMDSPDDLEWFERAAREERKAQDCRTLAMRLEV